ncbi:Cation-independent mannose-6-phosphate receptor [Talaromyces islandicus]|uniref:Cation-independent mannose-6-phosphate receptor n=1 Tax=Talaromyces islandicus TaxID=28573 RepID=A0A0U1LQI6_TALIS|nr:Cation-independent mannose-6-phosphate receptor [Talaromyces islandicus]
MPRPKNSQSAGRKSMTQRTSKRKACELITDTGLEPESPNASSDGEADIVAHRTTKGSGSSAPVKRSRKKQKVEEQPLPESEFIEIDYIDQMKTRFAPKNGLAGDLPPLHDLDEIFQQITMHAGEQKFGDFIDCLGGRELRVATMCSGTESPILALEMVISQLKKSGIRSFAFKHLFSAEIVEFKQAFIERNFHPPILFKDVKELNQTEAHTAYGAKREVPTKPDILVAGFSCVDYSNLNNWRKTFGQRGESDDTLRAVLAYCEVHKPRITVLENLSNAPWSQIGPAFEKIGYHFRSMKVDTKDFYLPQTRERCYALCIQKSLAPGGAEWLEEWVSVFTSFKRRASSPFTEFIDADDDVIEKRKTERVCRTEPKSTTNWSLYTIRHADVRRETTFGNGRPITHWQEGGKCCPATWMDRPWFFSQVERVWDTIDVNHLRTLAVHGYDNSFKVRCIDISQGVDRDTDNRPMGIIGCITPCGMLYATARGSQIQGRELLLLQGMPLSRLSLSRETQSQMQDLAGNAMSTPVIASALLSAIIVSRSIFVPEPDASTLVIEQSHNSSPAPQLMNTYLVAYRSFNPSVRLERNFVSKLKALAGLAVSLCSCEGSDGVARYGLYQCQDCKTTACAVCVVNPIHNYQAIPVSQLAKRIKPKTIRDLLLWLLPAMIQPPELPTVMYEAMANEYTGNDEKTIHVWNQFRGAVTRACQDRCFFQSIKRSQVWKVLYEGHHSILHLTMDSQGLHWCLYAKPPSNEPSRSYIREVLRHPIARMDNFYDRGSILSGSWQICTPLSRKDKIVKIRGSGKLLPSYEDICGIPGEEPRRQVWSHIVVECDDEVVQDLAMDIRGQYERIPNCGGASQSLHRRVNSADNKKPLFFYLDPRRLGPSQLDSWVFSPNPQRKTDDLQRDVVLQLDNKWEYQELLSSDSCSVRGSHRRWVNAGYMSLINISDQVNVRSRILHAKVELDIGSSNCYNCYLPLIAVSAHIFPDSNVPWKRCRNWEVLDMTNFDEMQKFSWLWSRFTDWSPRTSWETVRNARMEKCERCSPQKPRMAWTVIRGRERPVEDPVDGARCERDYKLRPWPFRLFSKIEPQNNSNPRETGHLCFGLNIKTLLHRACRIIAHRHNSDTRAEFFWRMTDNDDSDLTRPGSFRVLNNNDGRNAPQPPSFKVQLREDQLRSLHWTLSRESQTMETFPEEEVEEAILKPLNWRAEAKVIVYRKTRGGILADQVGFGKTAVILGLIDTQHRRDSIEAEDPCENAIPLKATCIVVPDILFDQWQSEIVRFLGVEKYIVLCVGNTQTLSSTPVEKFQQADIVLVSWSTFSGAPYFKKLEDISGGPSPPKANNVRMFEAWFEDVSGSIESQVKILQAEGPEAYLEAIKKKQDMVWGTDVYNRYLPSKRLTGKTAERTGTSPSVTLAGLSKRGNKAAIGKSSSDRMQELRKKFGISKNGETPMGNVEGTVFHMYRFQRLVIDEFTYLNPDRHALLATLKARSRWILSGTPPIKGFAAAERMARLINVFIGRVGDEDYDKAKYKRSESENFQFFTEPASEGWHFRRNSLAQHFIDVFMRQNTPCIPRIEWCTHYNVVTLSAVERILYLELKLYFESYNPQAKMEKKEKYGHDQRGRISEIVDTCKTPEESLVKRSSIYDALPQWSSATIGITTGKELLEHRLKEVTDIGSEIAAQFKAVTWLYNQLGKTDSRFDALVSSINSNDYGDKAVSKAAQRLINHALEHYQEDDWKQFWLLPGSILPRNSGAPSDSSGNDQNDEEGGGDDDREGAVNSGGKNKKRPKSLAKSFALRPRPEGQSDMEKELRQRANKARVNILALVERFRSLRFARAAYKFQSTTATVACHGCGCRAQRRLSQKYCVLGKCGHVVCPECITGVQENKTCAVDQCRAAVDREYAIPGAHFRMCQPVDTPVFPGGSKLQALIGLLQDPTRIPETDQVILFIQFKDLEPVITSALESREISYVSVGTSGRTARNRIREFSAKERRVAILQLGTENSAGLNLQNANHVIFFGTYAATNLYEYQSAMTQSSGRVIRFGQEKEVHIWNLLALNTMEVGILQIQDGRTLIKHANGEYELISDDQLQRDDTRGFEIPSFDWK